MTNPKENAVLDKQRKVELSFRYIARAVAPLLIFIGAVFFAVHVFMQRDANTHTSDKLDKVISREFAEAYARAGVSRVEVDQNPFPNDPQLWIIVHATVHGDRMHDHVFKEGTGEHHFEAEVLSENGQPTVHVRFRDDPSYVSYEAELAAVRDGMATALALIEGNKGKAEQVQGAEASNEASWNSG